MTSSNVNEYLQNKSGENITAKNFRTWAGTVKVVEVLLKIPMPKKITEAKKKMNIAIKAAAKILDNTPSICRKNYIHPLIINSYISLKFKESDPEGKLVHFSKVEAQTLAMLESLNK